MSQHISYLVQKYKATQNEYYFIELLHCFVPLIKTYACKLYYLEYDDCIQELSLTLYEAITKMPSIQNEYSCIAYIKKCIINKFCKLYHESLDAQQQTFYCVNVNNAKFQDYFQTFELNYILSKIDLIATLAALPCLKQNIAYLLLNGYSDQEIAHQLGYSRQYINRIKKHILI